MTKQYTVGTYYAHEIKVNYNENAWKGTAGLGTEVLCIMII